MQATNGQVIYSDGDTVITDQEAKIGAQTFPLHSITSASLVRRWANGAFGWGAVGIGLLILIVGYFVWDGVFLTPMLGGCVLILAGLAVALLARGRYVVQLTNSDGEVASVKTPKLSHAQQIVDIVNKGKNQSVSTVR